MWQLIPDCVSRDEGDDSLCITRHRRKVLGGWILRTVTHRLEACATTEIFVPDPEYKWDQWKLDGPECPPMRIGTGVKTIEPNLE